MILFGTYVVGGVGREGHGDCFTFGKLEKVMTKKLHIMAETR